MKAKDCVYFEVCLYGKCPCRLTDEPKDQALFDAAQIVFDLSLNLIKSEDVERTIARESITYTLLKGIITDAQAVQLTRDLYTKCDECVHSNPNPIGCKLGYEMEPFCCTFIPYPKQSKVENFVCEGRR